MCEWSLRKEVREVVANIMESCTTLGVSLAGNSDEVQKIVILIYDKPDRTRWVDLRRLVPSEMREIISLLYRSRDMPTFYRKVKVTYDELNHNYDYVRLFSESQFLEIVKDGIVSIREYNKISSSVKSFVKIS